ncbi:hypothetical protein YASMINEVIRUS_798 [Yasminevirus sp. GU-2018]|uniref:Uncharacterized protein n=1 Tax=Yasminevirus sp. GU-2018 TaxID=2420051 RepID=A0A5K0U969_9VIRU|nr:hypothetical protein YASMINEVIRUS_798 [Yasminevirus sp. GU-2018]
MPKHSYQLVNPVIEGTFKDVYDANTPIEAAKTLWLNLTEHIVSHVPKFMFTMRDITSDKLHHFEVSENRETSSFTINTMDIEVDKKVLNNFIKSVDSYSKVREQKGGAEGDDIGEQDGGAKRKRYDDDSSSSSSSSTDIYPTIRRTSPIAMFHYNTRVYYTNTAIQQSTLNPQIVAVTTPVFTPIFRPVLGTFVGIWP